MITLSDKDVVFRLENGPTVIYTGEFGEKIIVCQDGKYYATHQMGFGGTRDQHSIPLAIPQLQIDRIVLTRDGDQLEIQGLVLHLVKRDVSSEGNLSIEVVPLPTIRKPEYLFALPDGKVIYVGADLWNYSYESFRLFVETDGLSEIKIVRVTRYHDGGATDVVTKFTTLHVPAPGRNLKATWGNVALTELDPALYVIMDTGDHVVITPRSVAT